MVDYSKWNSIDVSDTESESGEPEVTGFDGPQSVTFGGGDGSSIAVTPSTKPPKIEDVTDELSPAKRPRPEKVREPTRNGGSTDRFDWSQTGESVYLSIFVPAKTVRP